MLKKNNNSRPVSSKIDGNRPAFRKNVSNNKVNRFGNNNVEHAKKLG